MNEAIRTARLKRTTPRRARPCVGLREPRISGYATVRVTDHSSCIGGGSQAACASNGRRKMAEIRNRETFLGIGDTNADGSPVKEVINDEGDAVAEIHNRETFLGIGDTNADGSPVKEVVPKND